MNSQASLDVLRSLSYALVADWATTLTLIFGGCCSNALTLEQLTSQYPRSGTLITFTHFVLVSLHGLPKFITFAPYPKLRPRRIPLLPYLLQVLLFYAISLLNNSAFAYKIPVPIHIIFRSGGLVVSMLMGWLLAGKRYNLIQMTSVILVTLGVVLTTLSASPSRSSDSLAQSAPSHYTYSRGILILTVALFLSGILGVVQDKTYSVYGRMSTSKAKKADGGKQSANERRDEPQQWQESMFYLHFLSMPMFFFIREDLVNQYQTLYQSPRIQPTIPSFLQHGVSAYIAPGSPHFTSLLERALSTLPMAFIPLLLNAFTQLFCIAGVHRLTSRVSSLTVTLVLVVRKAVSLLISTLLFGSAMEEQKKLLMWSGAGLVFAGTVAYSLASGKTTEPAKAKKD